MVPQGTPPGPGGKSDSSHSRSRVMARFTLMLVVAPVHCSHSNILVACPVGQCSRTDAVLQQLLLVSEIPPALVCLKTKIENGCSGREKQV